MRPFGIATLVLSLLAAAPPVLADGDDVVIEDAWSRASIGTSRPGVAYMTLRNTGAEPVMVTGMRTDLAMMPMIHATTTDAQGVTRMSHMEEVEIAAGEAVALAPGGLHVMLMDLQRPMVEGESYTLSVIFADGTEASIQVPILGMASRGPAD
ncbi:MAG: copper chaperone PCu(A)C [Pseudotabrizicola sp.]|uniref:copper chaperone PCu(A)C n=1 Tax=Pseudotabrizicola sp. TaxID=2939647 RepID=UPI00273008C4|nr:copper chaperone PCu(A)C [Pseudotabrizicola sp.]MDP2081051.1 copper chaperone PCu(A)C [Pseudotabrizicola sp.]MDZ7573425.1 copper chaperone PCu(A)C [Pseudotabrizicola sp.]